jgi:hypothetical protein
VADPFDVEMQLGQQFVPFAMLDEPIRQAQTADVTGLETSVVRRFEHGAAEAPWQGSLFHNQSER